MLYFFTNVQWDVSLTVSSPHRTSVDSIIVFGVISEYHWTCRSDGSVRLGLFHIHSLVQ